jgi:hypothetical protein
MEFGYQTQMMITVTLVLLRAQQKKERQVNE